MKSVIITVGIFSSLLLLPWLVWLMQDETPLSVAVINKTVAEEDYREHQAVHWLLNHRKYTQPDGSGYKAGTDYYGVHPDNTAETYETSAVPDELAGHDLIYIADTYGVYQADVPWHQGEAAPPPEDRLYGGWEAEEWAAVSDAVDQSPADLVMEFNTFASPTAPAIRDDILDKMQMNWDGWTGRWFHQLEPEEEEVPPWLISQYEAQGESWNFEGGGFAFVQDFDHSVVIMPESYLETPGIHLSFRERGEAMFGVSSSPSYSYWFDIVEPFSDEQVLADYTWDTTEEGRSFLAQHDIPASFPAVLHHEITGSNLYYFAGDFTDLNALPPVESYAGYAGIRQWVSPEFLFPESSFFWQTMRPMMDSIFAQAAEPFEPPATASEKASAETFNYSARMGEDLLEVYRDGSWEPMIVQGINLGMGRPGTFPGEASIQREEYQRWFEQIAAMHANTIRIYTIHPPAFYEELLAFNQEADEPIYVMHGVWIDEYPLEDTLDAFDPDIVEEFESELRDAVDVIHGDAILPTRPGHASGLYTADISPYVTSWMLGIEWYPFMVDHMLQEYPDLGDYDGTYVETKGAAPFEHWMAARMDHLYDYEKDRYETMRPMSFTNWVTTDNLDQPSEPHDQENLAQIDPNTIYTKAEAEETGMFASYHIYPYYPDFLNLEEKYLTYEDHEGRLNSYAGYLNDLRDNHRLPILAAEFGIPASRGKTHSNVYGWDQGFMSEKEQGDVVSMLYETILAEDYMGGLVFTWQDEWFKRTWNTMDYDNPDRRPFWSNAQTPEQQFGLLSFDRHAVRVNGDDDWQDGTLLAEGSAPLTSLEMHHDERYLYLKWEGDFEEGDTIEAGLRIRDENGIDVHGEKADFLLRLHAEEGELRVAGDYDPFFYDYVQKHEMLDAPDAAIDKKHERFHPIYQALNKEMMRPDTGEVFPMEYHHTGKLREGVADPDHEQYDSLNDFVFNAEDGVVEVRLAWMLLNARDPSSLEFIGNIDEDDVTSAVTVDGIGVHSALIRDEEAPVLLEAETDYAWDPWNEPQYEERLKESYQIIQDTFAAQSKKQKSLTSQDE
ncbi:hypothetical protein [Alkalicoccus chagannorensis]|uniref:hypothetical protein n=1 Tax=Alkalicoccus chagannorensis TaxID=427072 RepID=UPI0004005964|nr:hypothetical protein [Alkalicoccus chagannorensis]